MEEGNANEIQFLALNICKGQHIPKYPVGHEKNPNKTIPSTHVLIAPGLWAILLSHRATLEIKGTATNRNEIATAGEGWEFW